MSPVYLYTLIDSQGKPLLLQCNSTRNRLCKTKKACSLFRGTVAGFSRLKLQKKLLLLLLLTFQQSGHSQ